MLLHSFGVPPQVALTSDLEHPSCAVSERYRSYHLIALRWLVSPGKEDRPLQVALAPFSDFLFLWMRASLRSPLIGDKCLSPLYRVVLLSQVALYFARLRLNPLEYQPRCGVLLIAYR